MNLTYKIYRPIVPNGEIPSAGTFVTLSKVTNALLSETKDALRSTRLEDGAEHQF